MSDNEEESKSIIPSELRLSSKWDVAIPRFVAHSAIGSAVGLGVSLVLFRSNAMRFAGSAFGAGFGSGNSFRIASYEFEEEKK